MKILILGVLLVAACASAAREAEPAGGDSVEVPTADDAGGVAESVRSPSALRERRQVDGSGDGTRTRSPLRAPGVLGPTRGAAALAPGDSMTQSYVRRVTTKAWGGYTLTTTFTRTTRSVRTSENADSETVETYVATTTRTAPPATSDRK